MRVEASSRYRRAGSRSAGGPAQGDRPRHIPRTAIFEDLVARARKQASGHAHAVGPRPLDRNGGRDFCRLALVPHGKSLALSCHRGDGGERLPLHGSAAAWLPAGGAGSGSTGHGGRVGDDPPPRKRIFAVFWLVRQRVWIRDSARPGQGGVAGLHPRPRQAATPPAYSSSSTTCRWRSFCEFSVSWGQ